MGTILETMIVNSARHITFSGRSLRIDSSGESRRKDEVVVFTREINLNSYISEDTRIVPDNIAKLMGLRKYIPISEKISVKAGSFDIGIESVSPDRLRYNIVINDSLYFLSFVPEVIKPIPAGSSLLVPADKDHYDSGDTPYISEYIKKTSFKTIYVSGDFSSELHSFLKESKKKIIIVNETFQPEIF